MVIRGESVRASVDPATGEQVFLVEDARGEWIPVSGRNAATPAYAAITDWLNFTFPFDAREDRLGALLKRFQSVLGRKFFPVVERPMGKHNYERSFEFGDRIKASWANTLAWREAVVRAGMTNFRWHDLRHTWASWLAQNGVPLSEIQEMGGWESHEMIRRYAHLAPANLATRARVVDRLLGTNSAQSQMEPVAKPLN